MESTKHVVVSHFVMASGRPVEEVYAAVCAVADEARGHYDEDVAVALRSAFSSDDSRMFSDVVLLENQLPWVVVEMLMGFAPAPGPAEARRTRERLPAGPAGRRRETSAWDGSYSLQHLLSLLRHYIVGTGIKRSSESPSSSRDLSEKAKKASISVSVVELAEMGVRLTATKTGAELKEMGMKKALLSGELFLGPLLSGDGNFVLLKF
ncbi:hypothetical protein D1007_34255 [Hordeum vulgare]|nr:hypothetical protein D1007_34255 [Hordeum vulgare]